MKPVSHPMYKLLCEVDEFVVRGYELSDLDPVQLRLALRRKFVKREGRALAITERGREEIHAVDDASDAELEKEKEKERERTRSCAS